MKINIWLVGLLFISGLMAQENSIYSIYNFSPVVITGSRIPTEFSNSPRNVIVIDEETIKQQNAESLDDLLRNITDLKMETRGPLGIQSDISIRGASGEQTLILFDGMKISDPQTAHHSLNVPVTMNDIARIEILKGNASKVYGPNAMGGVINIITKNTEKACGNITLSNGEYGYLDGNFSYTKPVNNISQRLSLSHKTGDGYRKNTDFNMTNIFYKSGLQTAKAKYDLSFGYQRKDFGANSFYSANYPMQHEDTESFLVNIGGFYPKYWGHLSIKLSGRKHFDHFILDRNNPSYYENKHTSHMISAEMNGYYEIDLFKINFGSEIGYDDISSTSLGDHYRIRSGVFSEAIYQFTEKISISPGISGYYYKDWDFQIFPGVDFKYQVTDQINLHGSWGKSFRIPSFTDLYYKSPANMGNVNLKPEKASSYELGTTFTEKILQTSLVLFYRNTTNLIEFTRAGHDEIWKATNISEMKTSGIEVTLDYRLKYFTLQKIGIKYSYMDNSIDNFNMQNKYLANSLNQNAVMMIFQKFPFDISASWNIIYQEIMYKNQNTTLVNVNINFPWKIFNLYLDVDNMFDTQYAYFNSVPMPGRWIKFGIKYNF